MSLPQFLEGMRQFIADKMCCHVSKYVHNLAEMAG